MPKMKRSIKKRHSVKLNHNYNPYVMRQKARSTTNTNLLFFSIVVKKIGAFLTKCIRIMKVILQSLFIQICIILANLFMKN